MSVEILAEHRVWFIDGAVVVFRQRSLIVVALCGFGQLQQLKAV